MSPVDIVIVVYAGFGALVGFQRGLAAMVLALAGYAVALVVARAEYLQLARWADQHYHLTLWAQHTFGSAVPAGAASAAFESGLVAILNAIVFLLVVVLVELLFSIVTRPFATIPNRLPVIGGANRLLGAGFGVVEHLLIVGIILMIVVPLTKQGPLNGLAPYLDHGALTTSLSHYAKAVVPSLWKVAP